jgi:4-amino-4-deoxy-L-arabinose transferase-like glycosyltransferase
LKKIYNRILAAIGLSMLFLAFIFAWAAIQYGAEMELLSLSCGLVVSCLAFLLWFLNWLYPDDDSEDDSEDG